MISSIKELARELYRSRAPISLYELHRKYGLGPADVSFAARFLARVGAATQDGVYVSPTPQTRAWIKGYRHKIFLDERRPWAMVDRLMRDPNEPYLPDLSKVDRAFFTAKIEKVRQG